MRPLWFVLLCLLSGCAGVQEQQADKSQDEESEPARPIERTRKLDNAGMEELARTKPLVFLEECLARYDRDVHGYRVTLLKQEFREGKLQPLERIESSFRENPFSVLMVWKEGIGRAKRTLYVKGENDGKVLAVPAGLLSWLPIQTLDPTGSAARRASRFPITEFGMKNGTLSTRRAWRAANKRGELKVVFVGEKRVPELNDRLCWELKRIDYEKPEEDGIIESTYYFDKEKWLQRGSILKGEKDKLIATYFFRDLELNPEFAEDTFTREGLKKE